MKGDRFRSIKLLLGLCFAIFFTVTLSIASAESAPDIEWQKYLGGSASECPYSIQQTSDGGYIVAGYTSSNDGDVTGNHKSYTSYFNKDFWVVKLDSSGNIKWQKCLGGSRDDEAYSVQQTSDGGYIVAGYTTSEDGNVTGKHTDYENGSNPDYWVVKLDSSGNIMWQKCFGGSGVDYAYSIQQTSDSGYIVAGYTTSEDGNVTGKIGDPFYQDYWVVKLNESGSIVWQKCLGGSFVDVATCVQQTSDGSYIVTGYTCSYDGDVTGNHADEMAEYWVVKLDTGGNILWQKCLGSPYSDLAYSIQQTSDDGYIVAGYTYPLDGGDVTGNHGSDDYWVVKLDSSGNIVWQKCLGGSHDDKAYSVQQTSDGGYIVAGYITLVDSNGYFTQECWVVKLDSSGNMVWQKCLGGPSAHSIQQTSDGGYIIAGGVTGDFWVVKLSRESTVPAIKNLTSYSGSTWINWTWSNPSDPAFNHTEIYLNNIFQTNTSAEYFNATGLEPETSYTISTRTVDISGNVNETWVNATATIIKASILAFPGYTNPPTDLDQDSLYEDINGNGMLDFDDVVAYYDNMEWLEENVPLEFFDYNKNELIDFDDVVKLYDML